MAERKKNYINNPDLYNELIKYYEARKRGEDPPISNYIGQSILLIANNMIKRPNFSGYTSQWKDEMKSDGIRNSVLGVNTFNPEKSTNPFGFFSRIIWNAFLHRIKLEKKQTAIKHKNRQNNYFLDGEELNDDVSNGIIESYEKSVLTAKEKSFIIKQNKDSDKPKKRKIAAKIKKK